MIESFFDPVCPDSRDVWPSLKQALEHYGSRVSLIFHPFSLLRKLLGAEKDEPSGIDSAVVVEEKLEEKPKEQTEMDNLKKALVDLFYGTDRGLKATSDMRDEIVELINQLEAKNSKEAPTEALPLLNGKWVLAYTSFAGLFPLLSRGTLPLVKVEEISQTIQRISPSKILSSLMVRWQPLQSAPMPNSKFEVPNKSKSSSKKISSGLLR